MNRTIERALDERSNAYLNSNPAYRKALGSRELLSTLGEQTSPAIVRYSNSSSGQGMQLAQFGYSTTLG